MVKYREILRLDRDGGEPAESVAFSCGCAQSPPSRTLSEPSTSARPFLAAPGGDGRCGDPVGYLPEEEPQGRSRQGRRSTSSMLAPGCLGRRGMTLIASVERVLRVRRVSQGEEPPTCTRRSAERHRKWAHVPQRPPCASPTSPPRQMQVDYVGDTMEVVDMDTGEVLKVYVFAAMPALLGQALRRRAPTT